MPRLLASVCAIAAALLLALPGAAGAHAGLERSVPAADAQVDAPPAGVTVTFSAQVVAGADGIQVFGPDGGRVDRGGPAPAKGTELVQAITASAAGTYGVAYQVSSEDGHVITGSFRFHVGDAAAHVGDDAALEASRSAAEVDGTLRTAFSVTRFVEILALLVAAGGGIFACVLAPEWRPRFVVPALGVLLLAYVVGFFLNAAIVRGTGLGGAFSAAAIDATSASPFGLSLKIRAIVAVVALGPALLLRFGPPLSQPARWSLTLVFAAVAASLSITGHAVTTSPVALRMPLDVIHVVAAAIWLGGLVQLGLLAPFAGAHVESIARFSRTAFASVVALLATGTYATFAELGLHPSELSESTYARLIVAKLLLYVGTMPLAWNNMSAFAPQIRRRPDDAPRMLRQYVWRESALLLVVLALTVWLIATPQPPR